MSIFENSKFLDLSTHIPSTSTSDASTPRHTFRHFYPQTILSPDSFTLVHSYPKMILPRHFYLQTLLTPGTLTLDSPTSDTSPAIHTFRYSYLQTLIYPENLKHSYPQTIKPPDTPYSSDNHTPNTPTPTLIPPITSTPNQSPNTPTFSYTPYTLTHPPP